MIIISVSVIIPFFENINWLTEAIDSVLSQTFSDYEIIVINDGSPEDVSTFLKAYENKIIYKFKKNGGPASARNLGIELARGKYIAFLDSDDIWYPDKLKIQVKFMEETSAIWSHTSYAIFKNGEETRALRRIDLAYFQGKVFPWCLATCPIATPCAMILSAYLKENPLLRFNEDMRFGQDWFLWLNIAGKVDLFLVPEVLTKVRIRGNNAARRTLVQLRARAQIWDYLKSKGDKFLVRNKVNFILRLAFKMCSLGDKIIRYISSGVSNDTRHLEIISKLLYFVPYLIFKSTDKLYFRKKTS